MIEVKPAYPMTAYHPIHGAVTVNSDEEAAKTFLVPHDWFLTPEEADAHRTDREAAIVIHNARRAQITLHEQNDAGVVKHSVTHQETVDRMVDATVAQAKADDAPLPKVDDKTKGAELLS